MSDHFISLANSRGDNFSVQPASMIQRQFWLINQMRMESSAYNIPSVFLLEGSLDRSALETSINEVIQRHEILRTNFMFGPEGLMQQIYSSRTLHLPVIDLSTVEPAVRWEEMIELVEREVRHPFDLETDPLLRGVLIRIEETKKHVLCLVMHHIITDLHSKQLFGAELCRRYNAKICGVTVDSEMPPQYAEYARRQLQWLQSPAAEEMVAFWRDELREQDDVLNLPADYVRPSGQTFNGGCIKFCLGSELVQELREFSRQHLVDIFVTLLTAFLVLLSRYTNQQRIVIGVPLANRRQARDKDIMGCFVNILPLAFNLENVSNFQQATRLVRMSLLEAHRRQEAPFEAILNTLQPKRDPSFNPVFQVGFTAEPHIELKLDHLNVEPIEIHNKGAQLDLFLNIKRIDREVNGYFEFNTDLFAPATIERMRDHYLTLLSSVSSSADQPLNLLPLLSVTEKEQLVFQFNKTNAPIPRCTLHQLLEKKALEVPEAIAVVFEGSSLTYRELNARSNQLAGLLRDCGVGPDTLVGVYLERSLEMLIAVYGILKAGGAYVPLDMEFPAHRISLMIEDAQPKVILTQDTLVGRLPPGGSELICLDRDLARINAYPTDNPSGSGSPENLVYVLFTSGSTGRPKGVQVPHRAVVNFLLSMQKEPGIKPEDVLLAVTTLSFDISVLELFLPLIVGAKVVIAGTEAARDGQALLALMQSSGVTMIQATPTTFHLLISAGWSFHLPIKVLCGGEPFPHELAQKLTRVAKSVWNMYGPTETTVWSTCHRITEGEPVLIGRPIANTQIYIVNDGNEPTPIGVGGELLIGGLGVSHGYLHRPELNEKQFVQDPFNPDAKTSLYRTGDLACYLPDGNIKMLGRIDHQIKIRGFRIELGEIETAIVSHPAVKQGVVKPYAFADGDVRLCAYVTLADGQVNVQLRSFLRDMLPEYMIPSVVTVLPAMPLTPNNKIDRKALPEPVRTRPEISKELALPQNEMETYLAGKWAAMLQLDQVGIDDSFFDLGGYSLLSVHLIAQLEQEMNIKIPIVKFYQHPTVRLFAQYLLQNQEQPALQLKETSTEIARKQRQAMAKIRKRFVRKNNEPD